MAFLNPTFPNLPDFATYAYEQGVPTADAPDGTLTTVAIDTSGNLTAASFTGTVSVGMALSATGLSDIYLATWNGTNAGTVQPVPTAAFNAASVATYSPYLQWAFTYGDNNALSPPPTIPAISYVLAVYNLAMHQLLKIGQDLSGQTFFSAQRTAYKLLSFIAGPVVSSADQATSNTLLAPDFLKGMTMADLDLLKTPWGQQYLMYAQAYGPNIVGVS